MNAELALFLFLISCPGAALLLLTLVVKGRRPSSASRRQYWTGIALYGGSIATPLLTFFLLYALARGGSDISGIHFFMIAIPTGGLLALMGATLSLTATMERSSPQ